MPDSIDVMQQMAQGMSQATQGASGLATQPGADFSGFQQMQDQPEEPQAAKPPRMGGLPNIVQLIGGMINPNNPRFNPVANQGRPGSRTDVFENFIGNFMTSLAGGLSQAGRGPGANLRGFAGAVTAPYQRDVAQFQQSQEVAKQQAQIHALTAQPRFDPDSGKYLGTMNDAQYQQYIKGQGAAAIRGASDIEKAKIAARAKVTSDQLRIFAQNGRLAQMKPAINPATNKPEYEMFDRMGNSMGFAPNTVVTELLSKTSSTQQYMQDGNGVLHVLPKTTVTRPNIPGAAPQPTVPQPGQPATIPQPGQAQTPGAQPKGAPVSRIPQSGATTPQAPPTRVPKAPASSGGSRIVPGFQGKAALETGYAYDENNRQIATTRSEAATSGLSGFMPVTPNEMDKHKNQLRQLNDVQMNTSRYTVAAQKYAQANLPASTRMSDQAQLHDLMNKAGVADINFEISQGGKITLPMISSIAEGLSRESKSAAYAGLSPQAKELYDGFLGQMSAVPAYQKALTNIGRTNKEMMDLELANIAPPTYRPEDILRKQTRFQQNIERASEGFPKFRDMKTPSDVRGEIEQIQRPRAKFGSAPNPFQQQGNSPSGGKEIHYKVVGGRLVPQ